MRVGRERGDLKENLWELFKHVRFLRCLPLSPCSKPTEGAMKEEKTRSVYVRGSSSA